MTYYIYIDFFSSLSLKSSATLSLLTRESWHKLSNEKQKKKKIKN